MSPIQANGQSNSPRPKHVKVYQDYHPSKEPIKGINEDAHLLSLVADLNATILRQDGDERQFGQTMIEKEALTAPPDQETLLAKRPLQPIDANALQSRRKSSPSGVPGRQPVRSRRDTVVEPQQPRVLKPQSPSKVKKSAQRNAAFHLTTEAKKQLRDEVLRLQQRHSAAARENHHKRRTRDPHPPIEVRLQPKSEPRLPKPQPAITVDGVPLDLPLSAYNWNVHPLALTFKLQVTKYQHDFRQDHLQSIASTREYLNKVHLVGQKKEQGIVDKFNEEVDRFLTPLGTAPSVRGDGTVNQKLKAWRLQATAGHSELGRLFEEYQGTLDTIREINEALYPPKIDESEYMKTADKIGRKYAGEREKLLAQITEQFDALNADVRASERAYYKKRSDHFKQLQDTMMQRMMASQADDDGGAGAEDEE